MDKEKNKRQKAVALKYDPTMAAPSVAAKGAGVVAENIIEKAGEADVNIYENPELVEELFKLDLGQNIPPELYEVVAQILIFVSDMDKIQGYRNSYAKE
jgi:flagellar biosynthesis protein